MEVPSRITAAERAGGLACAVAGWLLGISRDMSRCAPASFSLVQVWTIALKASLTRASVAESDATREHIAWIKWRNIVTV